MSVVSKCSSFILKPVRFHGINPKLTYEATGKSFTLPRFCTEEMKTARRMNKNVLTQIKSPLVQGYPAASADDLQRLTSTTIEDSFKRVEWTNPKDGKVYNILKQGETEEGNVIVRILDDKGGFVKEAELTPKTIGIPDNFGERTNNFGLPHGVMSTIFARRANPFARYVQFPITREQIAQQNELKEVWEYLNHGGKLDYLSCSYGANVFAKGKIDITNPHIQSIIEPQQIYDGLSRKGTRVLVAASNASDGSMNKVSELANDILVLNRKAEGVGSLSPKTGRISDFSISRNSELTQHYEVGEFTPRVTPHGINITGTTGTDIAFPSNKIKELAANPLLNKTTERVQQLLDSISSRIKDIQNAKAKLFTSRKPFPEIMKEKALLEQQELVYSQRRRKVFDYMNALTVVNGKHQAQFADITGTSVATPIRTAKLALNDMLEGII